MPLTNIDIKNAKSRDKNYRLYDEKGLYLEITPAGGKLWRLKYRFGGKEKRLAIGPYPEVGLKAAREARDTARFPVMDDRCMRLPGTDDQVKFWSGYTTKKNTLSTHVMLVPIFDKSHAYLGCDQFQIDDGETPSALCFSTDSSIIDIPRT